MTNLTVSEPSLLDSKLKPPSWTARSWARLVSITAITLSSLQQAPPRHIDRYVDDHKLYNQMRYEVMRHEGRRLS